MIRPVAVAAVAMLAGCALPVRQIVIPFRADLARDCRREGDLTADASRGSNRYLDRTPGSRWDRVRREAEDACLARPLNAEELAHQARQRQETEAREVREREARAEQARREAAARERERRLQEYRTVAAAACGGQIQNMMALATSSPYAVDGRCFEIVALGVSQWLSPTRALILNHSLLFETERPMTTAIVGTVIVRGIGGYTYEAAGGAMRTVPHVRMVEVGQRSQVPPVCLVDEIRRMSPA